MKTADALKKMGGPSRLARALAIKTPSIYSWGETVPELRQYQLREKFPHLFPSPATDKPQDNS